MSEMTFTIDEVLNEAIMSRTPAIIVEGIDDIQIYNNISNSIGRNVEVYAVETIDSYSEGCDQVIAAIQDLYQLSDVIIQDHIIGIIDRDVREYRNELPTEKSFLILKYYSIESHFVNIEAFEEILSRYTNVDKVTLGKNFIEKRYASIEAELLELYYFSLEALKLAVNPGYSAAFQYSFNNNRRKQKPTSDLIYSKIPALDNFASFYSLSKTIECVKKISHGKWLLKTFSEEVYDLLRTFPDFCGKDDSVQCQFCRNNITGKCTLKFKEGISNKTIYSLIFENVNLASLDYIKHRIFSMPDTE